MATVPQKFISTAFLAASLASGALAGDTPSAKDARVYFDNLRDGQTVISPFTVKFGISGMTLAPAGTLAPWTGHHHLIIDEPAVAEGDLAYAIPADDHHRHFGKAQTEALIALPKGQHTLQLLLGDGHHTAHNPPVMSDRIMITVE